MTDKKFLRRVRTNIHWALSVAPSPSAGADTARPQSLTEFLGYDDLFSISIPLTDILEEQWRRTRTIILPSTCCYCSKTGELLLPAFEYSYFGRRTQIAVLNNVPHCAEHGLAGVARICCMFLTPYAPWGDFSSLLLIGKNREFLADAGDMNRIGDIRPPWITFPGIEPWSGFWRQGSGEGWVNGCWRPFFGGLTPEQREIYLDKWRVPEEWEHYIRRESS